MATRPIRPKIYPEPPFLGTQSQAEIDEMNDHIAAGAMGYTIGSTLIRADDGVMLTLVGVGKAASFQASVAGGGTGIGPRGFTGERGPQGERGLQGAPGVQGVPGPAGTAANVPSNLSELLARVLPAGGSVGQTIARTANGYIWVTPTATGGGTTTPTEPTPSEEDYSTSVDALNSSGSNMRTQTAALS